VETGDQEGDAGVESHLFDHMSTWIELFYDLIFVAAILIFSEAVAHVHPSSGLAWIILVFSASWWVWFTTTVCANRFHMTDLWHRLLLLFQMMVIVLMAMEARASLTGDSTYLALEYAVLLATIAAMFWRAMRHGGTDRRYAQRLATLNGVASAAFFVAVFVPETARLGVVAIAFAFLVVYSTVESQHLSDFSARDERHFVERMGAFTLIVCGESFIEVAISVSNKSLQSIDVVSLAFEFVLVFAIFTGYFEDIPAAGVNQRRFGWWAFFNLVAQICIAGTAISASKLVNLDAAHRLPDTEILQLMVPLAALYVALAGISACTRRRPIGPLVACRLVTAMAVVVLGLAAWWIPWIHMAEALPIFVAIAIVNAVLVVRLRSGTEAVSADQLRSLR